MCQLKTQFVALSRVMDGQIEPAITSFSAGEFRRQPALSDNPESYQENRPTPSLTSAISLEEMMRVWRNCKLQATKRFFRGNNLLQCLIVVLLPIAVML